MLKKIHLQMVMSIAVNNRPSGNHLGIEHCVLADQAQKIATVAISPIEHGRYTKFSI
jgi:hypothetical protein